MKKSNENKPLNVEQASFAYHKVIRDEVASMAKIQAQVANLNANREKALQALNTAIVEEEQKKSAAKPKPSKAAQA